MKNKKNIGVLFSGGLDSTFMIHKILKQGNHHVKPYYIQIINNDTKTSLELERTELIIEYFRKKISSGILTGSIETLQVISKIDVVKTTNLQLAQPYLWTTMLPMALDHELDEVHIGYVMNDDAISYINEIKKLYYSAKPFMHYIPNLKFPLIKDSKEYFINELDDELVGLTITCEVPKKIDWIKIKYNNNRYHFFNPCGHCNPCKRIINNNYFNNKALKSLYRKHIKSVEQGVKRGSSNEKLLPNIDLFDKKN